MHPSRRLTLAALTLVSSGMGIAPASAALNITVPTAKDLGSRQVGTGTLTAALGTVTVTSTNLVGTWTTSVSSTNCTTGAGGSQQTVLNSNLSYWSGPVTATTGLLSVTTPGQATAANAVTLSTTRTAFSAVTLNVLQSTVSWNPTLIVNVPSSVVAGMYTCTVTHSVA
ncbi:hypothetical protein CcI49_01495 [Frankia sp. CcI49]|uniref:hypothetical protein n=1 Tax=unclassified Frankia TaxID=2632575 RepID=UPI0006CA3496|nr:MULTISPECIES: hypothetical protein [unclassified Frankia]KPM56454.1 hypothetical protein ACG83_00410 [Frankia sp. R43]ONH62117.1 hypothetical protein CcI49_01495 [Frankia sp. CcI49]